MGRRHGPHHVRAGSGLVSGAHSNRGNWAPRRWAATLFREAGPSALPRPLLAAGYLVGATAITFAALARQSGVPATKTVWAEDGKVFYSQAVAMPFWKTLLELHDGYVQLFPRLAVQAALLTSAGDASAVMAVTGAVSLACISCLVFHMARAQVASPALRGVLVAGMALLPVANVELLDNLVNVPWWLFFAAFWALLWQPRSPLSRVGAGLLCLVAAASEPLVGLLLPLGALKAFALGRRADQSASAGIVLGAAYEAVAIVVAGHVPGLDLGAGTSAGASRGGVGAVAQAFAERAGLLLLAGTKGTDWLAAHDRQLAAVLGAAVVLAILAAAARSGSPRVSVLTGTAVLCSAACFAVPVGLRSVGGVMGFGPVQAASRYEVVPLLLLLSSLVVTADHFARAGRRGAARGHAAWLAGAVLAAALAPTWVVDFRDPNARSHGPDWATEVASARAACASRALAGPLAGGAAALPRAEVAYLRTDRYLAVSPEGWAASLPCAFLDPP